jgi:excinuclease ABC subunit C
LGQWPEDEFIKAFIRDVYIDQEGAVIPSVICLDIFMKEGKPYEDILSYLAGHKVKIESYPRQDDTLAEEDMPMERLNDDGQSGRRQNVSGLLRLARKNAMMILKEESFKKSFRDKQGALLEIQKKLHLDKIPTVIQCLDISNLQDKSMVASLVSFRDGIPEKNQYRRYKLKLAKGSADDYAAIHEVTERLLKRIEKGEKTAPDLLLIDGGPGQLGAALMAKQQSTMNLGISMAAIAKKEEDIFLPHKNSPIQWDKNSRGKLLLRLIRDEAHRFAITYHRLLRNREGLQSILDAIPGIGKETRVKIQKIFKDHDNLQGITQEELRKIPGIGKKLAARIHRLIAKDDPSAEI